jgi:hypothetical protein
MNGDIAAFIGSNTPMDKDLKKAIFSDRFQDIASWRSFLRAQLNSTVAARLSAPASSWRVESFHALFIACWVHHPVEKGTYLLDLAGLTVAQRDTVQAAYKAHCSSRKSSHLSGDGRSASEKWNFLEGYKELLVQYEAISGRPYLMLKAEGHTTGLSGIVPHLQSYLHKRKTGEGLQASPFLNAVAVAVPDIVEPRAAENYDKGYEKLLKALKLKGTKVTARDMAEALFKRTGYPPNGNADYATFVMVATNKQLGNALIGYCDAATQVGAGGVKYRAGDLITRPMIDDLRKLAKTLVADGDISRNRVYREIIAKPTEVDASLDNFYAWQAGA